MAAATGDCVAVVGYVDRGRDLFNAAAVCAHGEVVGTYRKRELPNYAVFDEARYFARGDAPAQLWSIGGVSVGVSICEDAWNPAGPILDQADSGAEVIVNLNASPYAEGKLARRERLMATRAADASCALVYVNQVGGQDELVFDGGSMVFDAQGQLLARSPLEAASIVGSGPFVLRGQEDGELVFGAHSGGHAPPLLDGLRLAPAGDVVQRFLAGLEHRVVVEDRRDVAAIRAGAGSEAVRAPVLFDTPIMSTFYVGASPWNDPRLLEALHLAMDRVELATRLFGDPERGAASIFMLPPASGLSLGLNEPALQAFDGPVGLDARWRAARERWEAAGGAALGPITIDFPSIFDPRYAASAVVPALLNEALGVDQFRPAVLSYTTISRKAAEGEYGNGTAAFWFGWGPQFNDPAAARVLYETYHSAGPTARSLGFANDEVDSALQQLMLSARPDERAAPARQALSAIAANGFGGVIPWLVEVHDAFRWPLLTPGGPDGWWNQHLDVLAAVDSTSPRYRA